MKLFDFLYLAGVLLFGILCLSGKGSAEVSSNLSEKEIKLKESISISSEKMTVNHPNQKMIFEGHVKVIKGDLTLTSNRVQITLNSKNREKNKSTVPSFGNGEISIIEAEGNVHVSQGYRELKAGKAEYHQEGNFIILTGSPEGWDNHYRISGTKITVYLKEDRSVVEDSHVFFNP